MLPFKLVFGLLLLPFLVLRTLLKVLAATIVLPIVLLVGFLALVIGGFAFVLAILAPLVPLALVALLLVAIVKLARHRLPPATA